MFQAYVSPSGVLSVLAGRKSLVDPVPKREWIEADVVWTSLLEGAKRRFSTFSSSARVSYRIRWRRGSVSLATEYHCNSEREIAVAHLYHRLSRPLPEPVAGPTSTVEATERLRASAREQLMAGP